MGKLILLIVIISFIWGLWYTLSKNEIKTSNNFEEKRIDELIEYFEFQLHKLERDAELELSEKTKRIEKIKEELEKVKQTKNKLKN